jgi:hypothetical protein
VFQVHTPQRTLFLYKGKNPNKFKKKIQKYSKRNEELVTTNSWFEKHGLEILLQNINQPQINTQVSSPSTLKNEAC